MKSEAHGFSIHRPLGLGVFCRPGNRGPTFGKNSQIIPQLFSEGSPYRYIEHPNLVNWDMGETVMVSDKHQTKEEGKGRRHT